MNGLTEKDMQAVVNTYNLKDLYYPTLFPVKRTEFLTWKMLEGQAGLRIAGDLVARGASIPKKTREAISRIQGDIPKIAVSREMLERFGDAARVERVDGSQAAAQADDLPAEQTDEFGVVGLQVAGDDRVHAEGGHAPHLAAHERGFADGGQSHDEHAGLFDDAGPEPADRIAAHARAGRHAPSDGHALDGQRHVGAERPESPAHLGAGAEELVHRGHEPAPSAAP